MEKYKYGPLIYITTDSEDDDGNFYWSGNPPVGYDKDNIPIDKNGYQCLPLTSVIHPDYKPKSETLVHNHNIDQHIPTFDSFKSWFDDNFLIIPDRDVYFYIVRHVALNRPSLKFKQLWSDSKSFEEMIDKIWPDAQT